MNKDSLVFLDYHGKSRLTSKGSNSPCEEWPDDWFRINFKGYPRFGRTALPPPNFVGTLPGHELILSRRSERMFAKNEALTLEELSRVLSTLRITSGLEDVTYDSKRAYSSAGARYPIEAYILPLKVTELQSSLYHYNVRSHSLEKLWPFSQADINACFPDEGWCSESAVAVVLTACHSRTAMKYGERAYRYCLIEAGQIAQNMQLLCSSEGLACCNFGGFHDDTVMRLLDVDPSEEIVVHTLFFGKSVKV
jgi:SagB-type dehydrogenase family enzyme